MTKAICVSAQFPSSSGTYTYFVPEGDEPKVGDLIVTSLQDEYDGPATAGRGVPAAVKVATIVEVHGVARPKATKMYLMLLSVEELKRRRIENQARVEMIKKKAAAKEQLQRILEESSMLEVYSKLAETNPEAAELLAILKA